MFIRKILTVLKQPAVVVGLLIIGLAAWLLPGLNAPINVDQGIAATIAQQLLRGQRLYQDIWHFNLPGIHLTYAGAFLIFGQSAWTVNLLDVVWKCLTAVLVFVVGRSLWGSRVGLWSTVSYVTLAAFIFSNPDAVANKETFVALPLLLGVWLLWKAVNNPRLTMLSLLAGLSAGWAWYYKPTFIVVLVGLMIAAFIWCGRPRRRLARLLLNLLIGFGLSLMPLVVYFSQQHLWSEAYQQLYLFAGAYSLVSYEVLPWPKLLIVNAIYVIFIFFPAGVWAALGLRKIYNDTPRRRSQLVIVWLWWLSLASVIAQMKFFHYHWQVIIGPLSLLAGLGIVDALQNVLPRWGRRVGVGRAWLAITAAAVTLGAPVPVNRLYFQPLKAASLAEARQVAEVSDYLKPGCWGASAATAQVWGAWAGVYFLSGCQPATRLLYNNPLTIPLSGAAAAYQAALKTEFINALRRRPPAYLIVITSGGWLWSGQTAQEEMNNFPGLVDIVSQRYHLSNSIGVFDIYQLR